MRTRLGARTEQHTSARADTFRGHRPSTASPLGPARKRDSAVRQRPRDTDSAYTPKPSPSGEGPPLLPAREGGGEYPRLSVPWLGGNTRRGEGSTSPSARSHPALLGKVAARTATHTDPRYIAGRCGPPPAPRPSPAGPDAIARTETWSPPPAGYYPQATGRRVGYGCLPSPLAGREEGCSPASP